MPQRKPIVVRLRKSAGATRTPIRERASPTPERMRRAGGDFERGHTGQITMRDSPLERSFARGVITHEQYSAAQKYRHHWYHAGLSGALASPALDRVFAADFGDFSTMARTEQQVFHRQRYREAVQSVGKVGGMSWIGRSAARPRWSRSAIPWAGPAVPRLMPRRSSG
jgi:hypothetical protein